MLNIIGKTVALSTTIASLILFTPPAVMATQDHAANVRHVDLAIALDVSGSMSGLIESAKQRLWDITNELGRAQPQPSYV